MKTSTEITSGPARAKKTRRAFRGPKLYAITTENRNIRNLDCSKLFAPLTSFDEEYVERDASYRQHYKQHRRPLAQPLVPAGLEGKSDNCHRDYVRKTVEKLTK